MTYTQAPGIDWETLYRTLFGRAADAPGVAYWQGVGPSILAQHGEQGLRQRMIDGAAPEDRAANTRLSTDWAGYMNRAAQQDAGINNMPFVVSDYGAYAGKTPEEAMALLYRQPFGGLGGLGGAQTDPNTQGR